MNYPVPSLSKPLAETIPFLRRARTRFVVSVIALSAGAALLSAHSVLAQNTVDNYTGVATGNLTTSTNWSLGAVPGITNDAVFPTTAATGTRNFGSGATAGPNLVVGSLDDLSSGTTVTIQNITTAASAVTITLGGSGDLGNSVSGNAADLFYVATGGTFNITGTGGTGATLGLILGQSGNFNVAGTSTISAAITGMGDLTRTGAGNLTLSGGINNTGTFTNSGTAVTVYPSSEITAVPAGSTYINGTVGSNVTGIVQNGTSDLVLNNIGTYNKGITIQNGIVLFSNGGSSLGASTNVITLGNASTTSNATLDYAAKINGTSINTGTFANQITVGPKTGEGVNVITATDYNLVLNGAISLTGGDLTIAPANTTSSSITVSGGITGAGNVFVSDVANNAGNVVSFTTAPINNFGSITFNNATINGLAAGTSNTGTNTITGGVGSNVTAITMGGGRNPLTISTGALNVNSGGTTLTNNNTAGAFTVSSTITGTGNLTLSSTNAAGIILTGANNYVGTTTLSAGGLFAENTGTTTNAILALSTGAVNLNGGTLYLKANGTAAGQTIITGDGTTGNNVTVGGNATIDVNVLSGSNAGNKFVLNNLTIGANTLSVTGGNTASLQFAGTTTLTGNAIFSPTTANLTLTGSVGDGGSNYSLTKSGAGTLTLNGANTFSGATTISAGTLSVGSVGNNGANSNLGTNGTINIGATTTGGTLLYTGTGETSDKVINLAGTTGGATIDQSGAGLLKFTSDLTATGVGAKTLTLQGSTAGTGEVAGKIVDSSTGATAVTKAGSGTWTLSGANTFTGGTTVSAGAIDLANALALQNSTVTVSAANGLVFDSSVTGNAFTFGGLAGNSNLALQNNATTPAAIALTVGGNNASTTYGGILSGPGSLTQNGTGTLTLSGVNTYSGGTTLSAGTLLGSSGATATNVLQAFGTGSLALNGGTLQLRGNGSGSTQTIITGNGTTGNNVTVGGATTINVDRNATSTGNTFQFNNLSIGASTLTVTGGNTYALNFAGTTTLTDNATFSPTTAPLTLTGGVGDGGSGFGVTKSGAGALTLSGTNTYSGTTTISVGTLQVASAGSLGSGSYAANIADSGTLQYSSSVAQTLSGIISGTGALTKDTGASALTLSNANTLSGSTTVSAGTIVLSNALALQNSTVTNSVANGLVFDSSVAGNAFTIGGLSGSQNLALQNNASTPAPINLSVGNNNGGTTFSGGLSGTGATLTKIGTGTLNLSGGNNITTAVVVNNGTVYSSGTVPLQNVPSLTINNGGVVYYQRGSVSIANGSTAAITVNSGGILSSDYVGNQGSDDAGLGAVTLNGGTLATRNQPTSGQAFVSGQAFYDRGALNLQYGLTAGGGTNPTSTISAVNTRLSQTNGTVFNVLAGSGTGGSASSGGGVDLLFSGTILSRSSGYQNTTLIKQGNGVMELTGANDFTSAVQINAGILQINSIANAGIQTTANNGAGGNTFTVGSATGLAAGQDIAGSNVSVGTVITNAYVSGSTTVPVYVASNTAGGTLGAVSATLNFGAANPLGISTSAASNLIIDGGTLQYVGGTGSTNRLFQVGAATVGSTSTIDSSGTGALSFTNTGALTYGTAAQTRTLVLTGTDTDTNTLAPSVGNNTTAAVSLSKNGTGSWTLTGANTYSGGTTVNAGVLTGTAAGAFGTGNVTVNPVGTSGTAADAATLNSTGSIASTTTVTVNSNSSTAIGTVNFNSGTPTIGGLSGNGSAVLNNGVTGTTLTVGGANNLSSTFAGVISQGAVAGSLAKMGTGTLTLTGANTYTGPTAVNEGTLLVNNTVGLDTGSGMITVGFTGTNGTLGGVGTVTAASALVYTGSTLAPGATIGATTGALTLNTMSGLTLNGTLVIGISGSGGTSLLTTGGLILSGATLNINGVLDGMSNYNIASYDTLSGTFDNFMAPQGYTINYAGSSFGAHDIELDMAPVPEPATWLAGFLAVGTLGWSQRRRFRALV